MLGSVGTVIYSHLQLPKQTETDALSKEIAKIEKELGFCNEKVQTSEQSYTASYEAKQAVMEQVIKPNAKKYSKNLDEFTK